jgi:hypothetical protein
MRLRYWTALIVLVCGAFVVTIRKDGPVQEGAAHLDDAALAALQNLGEAENADDAADVPAAEPDADIEAQDAALTAFDVTFSRSVGVGENLNILLAEAGLDPLMRAEVADAIGSEYDLQRLKPGYRLDLAITPDGTLQSASLEVEDGIRIHAVFGAAPSVRTVPPDLDAVHRAGEAEIGSSIYAALEAADIPTRFATDLELVLAGTLDLRRMLGGGEHLGLIWRENRLGARVIGEPLIDFAKLDLG